MRSPNGVFLPAIDHMRAFAALLVLVYHGYQFFFWRLAHGGTFQWRSEWLSASNPLAALVIEGHTGVTLFMVLSGFIFTNAGLGRGIVYPAFLLNRFLRIYPLMLTVAAAGALNEGHLWVGEALRTVFLFAKLPGALDFGPIIQGGAVTGLFWTISCEFQFYLIFPLLLALLNRWGPRAIVALIVGAPLLRLVLVGAGLSVLDASYWTLAGRIDQFLIGMLAAVLFRRRPISAWLAPAGLLAVGLLLQGFNQLGGFPFQGAARVLFPGIEALAWAVFVLGYLSLGPAIPRNPSAALIWIGEASYSIYLLHFAVLYFAESRGYLLDLGLGARGDAAVNVVILAVGVTLLSRASYRLIEAPFLRRRVRYLTDRPGVAAEH